MCNQFKQIIFTEIATSIYLLNNTNEYYINKNKTICGIIILSNTYLQWFM